MLIVIVLVAMISYYIARKIYVAELENSLFTQCDLISSDITDERIQLQSYADKYGKIARARVTFLDANGAVLADSQEKASELPNHSDRPEVIDALKNGTGTSLRFSTTMQGYYKYVAKKIRSDLIVRLAVPSQIIRIIMMKIIYTIILAGVLLFILAILLALLFTKRIVEPIKQLTNYAKGVTHSIYLNGMSDEILELGEAFTGMVAQLDETIKDYHKRNVWFETTINSMPEGFIAIDENHYIMLINDTAKKIFEIGNTAVIGQDFFVMTRNIPLKDMVQNAQRSVEINVKHQVYKAIYCPIKDLSGHIIILQDITLTKQFEAMRSEFVSNVTHELKTPLTSIRGFIETLKNGALKDEKVAGRFLEIIDIEGERLQLLINDILVLSHIENKKHDDKLSTFTLEDTIQEVVQLLDNHAQSKSVTIVTQPTQTKVFANQDRMKQLFINLVSNAITYNVHGGRVELSSTHDSKRVNIRIQDTGIGIAQEHVGRLFERFYRVDKGRSREDGGTGLGLSIVKHIVELYEGEIVVQSQPQKGSTFEITLPIMAQDV
ncbi:MAG: PAS domain-containing protein [Hyphomonadaceae bacterium]|nr:PAS domain-containing protein [Clostridia bacterium]